jgi:hypothetical protein
MCVVSRIASQLCVLIYGLSFADIIFAYLIVLSPGVDIFFLTT